MKKLLPILVLLAALALPAAVPAAEKPKSLLKNPGHWGAFTVREGSNTVCYMAGKPNSMEPKNVRRGPVWMLVTHRPYRQIRNEVSMLIGYPFKKNSEVTVDIDGRKFKLFTDEETAWADDADADAELVKAMRAGRKMVVRGVSARGTDTRDTYSLNGFTRAHEAINKGCKGT